ncbi:MAG: MotA/TolQ/ExbB proton channel family protein [Desulfovibrionaceae bacterium]|nr:MotA/TolQ/ExbB proton channel family protein [Desulfovibrionaceae bacterium]MDD4951411.1 MotA/TolQ/ExbB proton channel family protein [Desulfovibrionaceae bacterium]
MEIVSQSGFLTMLSGATLVVKLVLLLLAAMSLWSWTIIFYKLFSIGRAKRVVAAGYDDFQRAPDLIAGLKTVGRVPGSPLISVGTMAVREYRQLENADLDREAKRRLVKDTLRRILRQGVNAEMKRLSRSLPFLATCANAAPFIGLFGTVWGIMHAFHSIGQSQSAALATVAPGISEALVATAIGLGVAIPATIAYNFFLGMLGEVEVEMINFAGAFLNRVERDSAWQPGRSAG